MYVISLPSPWAGAGKRHIEMPYAHHNGGSINDENVIIIQLLSKKKGRTCTCARTVKNLKHARRNPEVPLRPQWCCVTVLEV